MGIKKRTSSLVVFASVFAGSILGAGITLIASPQSRENTKSMVKGSIDSIRDQVNESLIHTTARLVETGAVLKTKTSQNIESVNSVSRRVKKSFKEAYDEKKRKRRNGKVVGLK